VTLTIALLGAPRIEVDGEPLRVDTRKAVALLAYLAVTGHAHARDHLTALLWSDSDDEHARAALRRTLSALKAGLGGNWLRIERSVVSLAAEGIEIDVRRFRELAAVAVGEAGEIDVLTAAVGLHRDDLLAGFGLRDSVAFDTWQQSAAGVLQRELATALARLAGALAAAGRYDDALPHARRRLLLDPLDEPAHRRLIELLAALGRRAEALRQYRECVRLLDRELGVRPLPETTELYQAVNQGRLTAAEPPTALPRPLPPRLLVGRDREWAQLAASYAGASADGRVVALEGEAGIGKTRLGEDHVVHARSLGAIAVAVRAHPGEAALPYGLIADTIRAALAERDGDDLADLDPRARAEAAELVPELADGRAAPRAKGPGARQRFYEGLAQTLMALFAGPAPGVVFADDLHWADQASLDVLAYVANRLAGRPLQIIAAWRPTELARAAASPLARWPGVLRLELQRLSRTDVMQLAEAAGAAGVADRLFLDSEGLPLFVVEYLAAISGGGDAGLPVGVRELLLARLGSVSEGAGQLLAAAAVIGRTFDFDVLRETSGRSEDEALAGLDELGARGLIVEGAEGYDFSHEQLRRLALEGTGLARRRLLHRRAAEVLERRNGDPALIAGHYRDAGRMVAAAQAYIAAGERARSLYAYAEALEHYASALAHDHPEPARLHELTGDVHTLRGEYRAAIAAYEAAAALGAADGLAGVEHKLGRVYDRRGQWDLAERHFEAAIDLGGEHARVFADRSLAARHRGATADALAHATRALALATGSGDPEALAQAHNIVGMLLGDREHLERSLALAEDLPDPSVAVAALNNLALACARAGDEERSLELTGRALALCSRQGDRHREAALHNNLADLLHRAGRSEDAMAHLKQAAAAFAEIGGDADEMQPEVWMLVEW
jgi:DNA-binding SARP family transcriptional activator/predicted ATPase